MFEDYKNELFDFYSYRKSIGPQLSGNLENPGRQKLQKECLHAFRDENRPNDEQLLKSFFNPSNEFEDLIRSIEKFELDKFRPLVNFLVRKTNLRDELSVKLVAWLIGFDTYSEWRKKKETSPPEDREDTPDKPGPTDTTKKSDLPPNNGSRVLPPKPLNFKKMALISICILITGSGCFISWEDSLTRTNLPNKDEQCMYWTGYKYEPANCSDNPNHTLIPVNIHAINYFKKIRYPDTLTKYSLGKVWYSKINGQLEFFTDSGVHPIDTMRKVKPLTQYMLNKYVSFYRYIVNFSGWSAGIIVMTFLLVLTMTLGYRKIKSTYPKVRFSRIIHFKSFYLSFLAIRSK